MVKVCTKCGVSRPDTDFHKNRSRPDGIASQCKRCCCSRAKAYYAKHKNSVRTQQREAYHRHIDARRARNRASARASRAKRTAYTASRYATNTNHRISQNLRNRIGAVVKGTNKSNSTFELLGCSLGVLRHHLESQFSAGMSWNNYGKWHVDHVRPCASFDLTKESEQLVCFNFRNLQPLWAADNLSKGFS